MIRVFNFEGKLLSDFEPYSGFLHAHRNASIAATAFHPHHMILAASSRGDNHVNLFKCVDKGVDADGHL